AGRMVQRAQDREPGVGGDVHRGGELLDLVRADHPRVHSLDLVHLRPPGHCPQRRVIARQRQVAALREHDVVVQLGGQVLVQLYRAVVEGDALGGEVVGPGDGGAPPGSAAAEVALVQHGDVGDAVPGGQVVGGGQAVDAAADDDDVVGSLKVVVMPCFRPCWGPARALSEQGCCRVPGYLG